METQSKKSEPRQGDLIVRFQEELERVDGEFVHCSSEELPHRVADFLASIEAGSQISSPRSRPIRFSVGEIKARN